MCPEYADANNRLRSFVDHPLPAGQTAEALANAGFFYIGTYIGIPCIINTIYIIFETYLQLKAEYVIEYEIAK